MAALNANGSFFTYNVSNRQNSQFSLDSFTGYFPHTMVFDSRYSNNFQPCPFILSSSCNSLGSIKAWWAAYYHIYWPRPFIAPTCELSRISHVGSLHIFSGPLNCHSHCFIRRRVIVCEGSYSNAFGSPTRLSAETTPYLGASLLIVPFGTQASFRWRVCLIVARLIIISINESLNCFRMKNMISLGPLNHLSTWDLKSVLLPLLVWGRWLGVRLALSFWF